ncbi:MAG: hypothetical protein COB78_09895 [Hyphomicrobiales bacterium]|nr:MAG: hypothetical protein COB78_09895 [Hyphomicrobiales bacterium]
MLIHHRQPFSSFGLLDYDQAPVGLFTVLSINEPVGDCAAYQGVGPFNSDEAMIERIKAGGQKISEEDAKDRFPEIEEMGLRYRR